MSTFATLSGDERRAYVNQSAARLGRAPVLVEKDAWVTWMLGVVFGLPEIGQHVVFKGGTSLSKVYNAIQRFSEDIDLQLSSQLFGVNAESAWEPGISGNEAQRRVKQLEEKAFEYVRGPFRESLERSVTGLLGPPASGSWLVDTDPAEARTGALWFLYPTAISDDFDYVAKAVMLEPGSLADQRPTGTHWITAMLTEVDPTGLPDLTVEVVALDFERTFWEKATILHADYHRGPEANMGDRRSRHYSDFASLWRHERRSDAMKDLSLLDAVLRNKSTFFKSASAKYDTARPPTMKLVPPKSRAAELAADYVRMQSYFYADPEPFDNVIETLRQAERDINAQ